MENDTEKPEIFGYCVKCRERGRKILNPIFLPNKNGTYMAKGRCEVCDTVCCKFMSKSDGEKCVN